MDKNNMKSKTSLERLIEDQVCSLKLAKRLKELGVKQSSLFYWIKGPNPNATYTISMLGGFNESYHETDMISAFTAAELGERLPQYIDKKSNEPFNNFIINISKGKLTDDETHNVIKMNYIIRYLCTTIGYDTSPFFAHQLSKPIYDSNEANARAKMLIYLFDNNLIE